MNLARYLEKKIQLSGHTISSFAVLCNVKYNTLYAWLYGSRPPTAYQLIDLINALSLASKTTRGYEQRRVINMLRLDKEEKQK